MLLPYVRSPFPSRIKLAAAAIGLIGRLSVANASPLAAISKASIGKIWELWRKRPGSIMVPGHDVPMVQENGRTKYIDKREAAIVAWYDDDMEKTTLFKLTL